MKEIGEYLRKAREEKELSLKDIQEITKIRLQYLEAMENGDFEGIPGEVYRKGFLVNFANAVGLDGQQLLEKYYQLKNEIPQIQPVSAEEQPEVSQVAMENTKPESPKQENAKPQVKRLRLKKKANLWIGIAILILIAAVFLIIPVIKERTISLSQAADVPLETGTEPVAEVKQDSPEEIVTTQVFPAPITVYAEFSENVWVRVKSDGKYIYMENGVTFTRDSPKQVWTAQESMEIRVGNSGGIKLSFNGQELDTSGQHGVSKTYHFTPEGLVAP